MRSFHLSFLPQRFQQTVCWPGSTSPLSPLPARSCPRMLGRLQAGWPDGERQRWEHIKTHRNVWKRWFVFLAHLHVKNK